MIVYYCEQGNPYCCYPHCVCNTVRDTLELKEKKYKRVNKKLEKKISWKDLGYESVDWKSLDFDSWDDTEVDAYKRLIKVHNWDELSELIDGTIEDAMEVRNKFKEKLNANISTT